MVVQRLLFFLSVHIGIRENDAPPKFPPMPMAERLEVGKGGFLSRFFGSQVTS